MEKVTIKMDDGEITIPKLGKRVINNRIIFMFRVFSNEHIQIIYRNAIGACECTVAYLNREEFKNVVEGTITEWNNIVRSGIERYLATTLIKE